MPVILSPISLDKAFHEAKFKIIVNDLPARTEEHRQLFSRLASDTYEADLFSVMPKCGCPGEGGLRGEHLVGEYCPICNQHVQSMLDDEIYSTLWFRRPKGMEKLINPLTWIMLCERFTHSRFSVMNWLVDRGYNPPMRKSEVVKKVIASGIPRGYNNFIQNFDEILAYLFSIDEFRVRQNKYSKFIAMAEITHPSGDPLQQYLRDFRHLFFSDYVPIPNKMLLVVEKSAFGTTVDLSGMSARDAANAMFSIERDFHDQSPRTIENRTGKIICLLADFYNTAYQKHLKPKEGHLRKHTYGGRTNFSFRAVLTSHDRITNHDEIHIPWGVAVTCFNLHLKNRLMSPNHDYGNMTLNQATSFLMDHTYRYHPLLDRLFKELIAESPSGKIPVLVHRNRVLPGFLP